MKSLGRLGLIVTYATKQTLAIETNQARWTSFCINNGPITGPAKLRVHWLVMRNRATRTKTYYLSSPVANQCAHSGPSSDSAHCS